MGVSQFIQVIMTHGLGDLPLQETGHLEFRHHPGKRILGLPGDRASDLFVSYL